MMYGWLGQVSLRLVERGFSLDGFRAHPENIRQHEAFLGEATLKSSYNLSRPLSFRQLGAAPKCCNTPDGAKYFDHSTGECINTWNKSTPTDGEPSCVQNAQGEWVHPECAPPTPPRMEGIARRIPLVNVGRSPMMGQAATTKKKLIACVNGPDLYDVYNPDMTLVAKALLNPSGTYPDAQIEYAKFPPCPVPQATSVGGLCDVPNIPVLVCYTSQGMTLIDIATGAAVGAHVSGACLSLLSNYTIAQDGDPRCTGLTGAAAPVPSPALAPTPTQTHTQPSNTNATPPASGNQGGSKPSPGNQGQGAPSPSPGGGPMPVSNSEPIPAAGQNGIVPVLPPSQQMTTASAPTGAFPGQPFASSPARQGPIPTAKAPAPLPPPCPLGPVPLAKWVQGCMG